MDSQNRSHFAWLAAITVLVGAFLLFQVQPVISKIILPWFGGGPSVWTTCLLFFQVMLVVGYAYAHLLTRYVPPNRQAWVHGILVLVSLLTLPILPAESWKPDDAGSPMAQILMLLLVSVGIPYLLLSATGPLVQVWFARRYPDRSPYRLYALSNVGSLGGLLTYPFLVEPAMTSPQQAHGWSLLFVVYAVLAILLAVLFARYLRSHAERGGTPEPDEIDVAEKKKSAKEDAGAGNWDRLTWLLLPAFATLMLMAVTNHLCLNVAVIPFFWVVPLSVYLLTFIICFDRPNWYRRGLFTPLAMFSTLAVSSIYMRFLVNNLFEDIGLGLNFSNVAENLVVNTLAHLLLLLVACMLCHGELVKRKPPTSQLTSFYLLVSIGGALGGVMVSIICPLLFPVFLELYVGILVVFMFAAGMVIRNILGGHGLMQMGVTITLGMLLGIVATAQWSMIDEKETTILATRNFYGVLLVREDAEKRSLVNGEILHGLQLLSEDRRREPTTYYGRKSGVGIAIEQSRADRPLKIGAIGLGVGTIACYAKPGDEIDFFEINPDVIRLARSHFTFLKDCPVEPRIIQGDARLSLERMKPAEYDVLAVDAFSSDAIPVHLLTVEAIELYQQHIKPGGVIAIHVSNRHLRLVPVVTGLARHHGLQFALVLSVPKDDDTWLDQADWVLLTRNEDFLNDPTVKNAARKMTESDSQEVRLWTDNYTSLLEILKPIR